MRQLTRSLTALLRPQGREQRPQRNDHRKARAEAIKLSTLHKIEIEKLRGGGMNVWPPKGVADHFDPYHGDHYCNEWDEVHAMVKTYSEMATAPVHGAAK